MYLNGVITYEEALAAADSPTNLAWLINQSQQAVSTGGQRGRAPSAANFEDFELARNPEHAR